MKSISYLLAAIVGIASFSLFSSVSHAEFDRKSQTKRSVHCSTELNDEDSHGARIYKEGPEMNFEVGSAEDSISFENTKITASASELCEEPVGCHPSTLSMKISSGDRSAWATESLDWSSPNLTSKGHNAYLIIGEKAVHIMCFVGQ